MRILAVGDSFMPPHYFEDGFAAVRVEHELESFQVEPAPSFKPVTQSELKLSEYQGSPDQLIRRMSGVEVLAVHGAPVTDAVLDASRELKLLCCARGGPVNVDVEAVTARSLALVNTPGKNAEAVADLTLSFLIMLARGLRKAQRFLERGGRVRETFEGAPFIGSDLRGHTLGLVGYGNVGRRVALRALPFGMIVLAYDPYLDRQEDDIAERVEELDELLARSDFVSLHARANAANTNLFNTETFAKMRHGAFFVNTARESLVDEDDLDAALASGQLAGAALDVLYPHAGEGPHRLLRHENVVLTPHIAGATHETLLQGAQMLAAEITRFAAGEALVNVVNREVVAP
jgi:D-3-phosphoglycerate dehydrogenase / 2-oxoglutarate reductase